MSRATFQASKSYILKTQELIHAPHDRGIANGCSWIFINYFDTTCRAILFRLATAFQALRVFRIIPMRTTLCRKWRIDVTTLLKCNPWNHSWNVRAANVEATHAWKHRIGKQSSMSQGNRILAFTVCLTLRSLVSQSVRLYWVESPVSDSNPRQRFCKASFGSVTNDHNWNMHMYG